MSAADRPKRRLPYIGVALFLVGLLIVAGADVVSVWPPCVREWQICNRRTGFCTVFGGKARFLRGVPHRAFAF